MNNNMITEDNEISENPWSLIQSYTELPEDFYSIVDPEPVRSPSWVLVNKKLAGELGFDPDTFGGQEDLNILSGNQTLETPPVVAQAYAGHQFGHFTILGDGRAHLLGERQLPDGQRLDIQLKGSGRTPYSRRGDGRAALGPMLREYIMGEAMHALGIPTTRALAVIQTGLPVYRETTLAGAVLTRVAKSHLRIGTFEYAAYTKNPKNIKALADYTLARHFPEILNTTGGVAASSAGANATSDPGTYATTASDDGLNANHIVTADHNNSILDNNAGVAVNRNAERIQEPAANLNAGLMIPGIYQKLLQAYAQKLAGLVAQWQLVGFIHGVMNTDNMAISGETIDYGPCAFMEAYDPQTVFSSIDDRGRYAYGNQPSIAEWNLVRFAETLLPLFSDNQDQAIEQAKEILLQFRPQTEQLLLDGFRRKIGLFTIEETDKTLIDDLLLIMQKESLDFTNTFLALSMDPMQNDSEKSASEQTNGNGYPSLLPEALSSWMDIWNARKSRQPQSKQESRALMRKTNPAVIPRNHMVEAALEAATKKGDMDPVHQLLQVLENPYDYHAEIRKYQQPAGAEFANYRTFCGT